MNYSRFDALVMVHPDFDFPINPNYSKNVRDAVLEFTSFSKPIFVLPGINHSVEHRGDPEIIETLVDAGAHILPETTTTNYQDQVDIIAAEIDKSRDHIRLAVGGTYAQVCVYASATAWSNDVTTNHTWAGAKLSPVEKPIGFATVLDDLV